MSEFSPTSVERAIRSYFDALGMSDTEAFVSLFSERTWLEDPVGTPVLKGHEGVAKFHRGLQKAWSSITMTVDDVIVRGDRAAVRWSAQGSSATGRSIAFSGIDVIAVDRDGRIFRVEGYWDLERVIAQM